MSWRSGQRVGDYRLERELGAGGMGSVWLAEHLPTRSPRALKRLSEADPDLRERFRREGEALGRLAHPHVLGVHESFAFGSDLVLATEVAEGGDLSRRLQAGPLPLRAALDLTRALASALAAAHAQGILHRDLKPANVLFDAGGRPVLADFGLARLMDKNSLTATGALMGTPAYLAPELTQGARADVRSDVYGLAALLYACLSGSAPFERGNVIQTLRAVAEEAPPPLPDSVPAVLREVCFRGLAKAPEERFPTPTALAEALSAAALAPQGGPTLWIAGGLLALAALGVASALARRDSTPSSRPPLPEASRLSPSQTAARPALTPARLDQAWEPPAAGLRLGHVAPKRWTSVAWINARAFLVLRDDRYQRYRIGEGAEPVGPSRPLTRETEESLFSPPTRMLHATSAGFFHGGWREPPVFVPWGDAPQALPLLPQSESAVSVSAGAELPPGATRGLLWVSSRTAGVNRVDAYDLETKRWTRRLPTPGLEGKWECHVLTGRSDGALCAVYRRGEDHRILFWLPGSEVQVTKVAGLAERGAAWRDSELWLCNRRAQIFRFVPGLQGLRGGSEAASLFSEFPFGGVELRGIWFLPSGSVVTLGHNPLNLVEWNPADYTPRRTLWQAEGVIAAGARLSPDGRWALLGGNRGQAYLVSISK